MWQFVRDNLLLSIILLTEEKFNPASIIFKGASDNNLKANMNNNVLFVEQTMILNWNYFNLQVDKRWKHWFSHSSEET